MNRMVIKGLVFCVVLCGIITILLWCDIVGEQRFISQVESLVGEEATEVVRQFPVESTQTDKIVSVYRRRALACLWGVLGCDTGMAVYLIVSDGKIMRQGALIFWFPSMTMVECFGDNISDRNR